MPIPESEIERIKATRSILEFLENPKRAGTCLRARCPLPGHDDRTPSFYLYPDGGYWCFGCQRGGKDVISFAFQYWGLRYPQDFPEALERLGAHVTAPFTPHTFLPPAPSVHRPPREVFSQLPDAATLAVYRVAAEVWQQALWAPTGTDALAYLRERGLPDTLIRREGLGLATDALADELRRRGLDPAIARAAGLLRWDGRTTFAGRVVLWEWRRVQQLRTPVWATARLYGVGARWDDAPKYLNLRGDRRLIGLEAALGAPVIAVVEGAFDRLALLSFDVPAVALGSNDPPEGVLSELRRLAKRAGLFVIRDRDRAGRRGTLAMLYKLAAPAAARLAVVDLPRGIKDAGELGALTEGPALYAAALHRGRAIDPDRFRQRCDRLHTSVLAAQRNRQGGLAAGPVRPSSRAPRYT